MHASFQTKSPYLYYCIVYLCYVFFYNLLILFVNLCKPKYRTLYIKCFLYNYVTCLPTVSMAQMDTCFTIYDISTDYMHLLVHYINDNLYRILYFTSLHVYSNGMRKTYLLYIIVPLYKCVSPPCRESTLFDSQSTVFKKRENIVDEAKIMIQIMRSYYYNDIHLINYTMLMLQTIYIIYYYYIMYSLALFFTSTSHFYYYFNHLLIQTTRFDIAQKLHIFFFYHLFLLYRHLHVPLNLVKILIKVVSHMELTVFLTRRMFIPIVKLYLACSINQETYQKININPLYTKAFRFNEIQSKISYVTMPVLNNIIALPFKEPQSNNMMNDFPPTHNQIDVDRHDYTSLTNVEPDTNFNFNTNQTICKQYNGKEFNDMSDFPFHNISKKEMYDAMKLNLVTPHLYSKNNDFFVDIDPDTNMNTTSMKKQCANYNHLKFNNSFTEQKYIYFLHTNIRCTKKNLNDFLCSINNLHIKFTFIILSEIWGNSDTIAFYNIAGYTHIYETRDKKIGGGVSIYIMKTIPFKIRKDLQFTSEHIQSLFIEVDKSVFQSKCNVIVGALYKPPSLSIYIFNKQLERVLDIIKKEKNMPFTLVTSTSIQKLNPKLYQHLQKNLYIY